MNDQFQMTEWLAHVASKGAVVLMVALVVGGFSQGVAAARRYAVWITAMGAVAVLPLAVALLPAWRVLPQGTVVQMPVEPFNGLEDEVITGVPASNVVRHEVVVDPQLAQMKTVGATAQPSPAETAAAATFSFSWDEVLQVLPRAWLTVAGLLLARLGWSAWCLGRLEHRLQPGSCDLLHELARQTGLRCVPKLLIGAENAVPMVWGVLRQRLLLPQGFECWHPEKLRGVLLHELSHLKRGDPLALWVAQWVKALHWFNPLAWLTIRQLRADQEQACDDRVLRHGVKASEYAQHLLDLSRHTRVAPGLALCALTITRCSPVESRVKAILDPRRSREGVTRRWLLGLAGVALLATVPMAMVSAIEGAKLRGRILDRNGVVLAESTATQVRHYPLQTLAAHVVGYTGKAGPEDATPTGRTAMEKMQDSALKEGKDVALTLDTRVQSLVARAMVEGGIEHGAAVILDPRNGDILAAVSLPSYDLNLFGPTLSPATFQSYSKNAGLPLYDRCFSGEYPPGATFAPFTALAGISAGVDNPTFICSGSVTYGDRPFLCWKGTGERGGHGTLDMTGALVGSCNCYWYQFGNKAGLESFEKLGQRLGVGEHHGIIGHEKEGQLPPQQRGRPVSLGEVANLSIGQGGVLLTPLQMSVLAATVANGGKVPQPRLLRDNVDSTWRADLNSMGVLPAQVEQIREGMRLVVNGDGGTGKTARSEKVMIAAKTGTAQWKISKDQNLAAMIGFAPYDQPKIAFAILYEGKPGEAVSGGHNCGPVVKRVVEEMLALPTDGSGEAKPARNEAGKKTAESNQSKATAVWVSGSRELDLAQEAIGGDLIIKERKFETGRLTIEGETRTMIQALQFRDKLVELGNLWDVAWAFPVPTPTEDGKRVKFRATGTSRRAAPAKGSTVEAEFTEMSVEEELKRLTERLRAATQTIDAAEGLTESSAQLKEALEKTQALGRDLGQREHTAKLREVLGKVRVLGKEKQADQAAIIKLLDEAVAILDRQRHPVPSPAYVSVTEMAAAEKERWRLVQQSGALAELSPRVRVHLLTARDTPKTGVMSSFYFRFTGNREEVREWLTTSLSAKIKKFQVQELVWPDAPRAFDRFFYVSRECEIMIHSDDGKTIEVTIEKKKLRLMIAPDESTPPRPKTAAPRELDGVVSTEPQAVDSSAQTRWVLIRPSVEVEEALDVPETPGNPFIDRWPVELRMAESGGGLEPDQLKAAMDQRLRHKGMNTALIVR